MRRKKNMDESGGPNWIDTYADMVTLILTFFILLFSISSINAEKWEVIVKSFTGSGVKVPTAAAGSNTNISDISDISDIGFPGNSESEGDKAVGSLEEIKDFDDLYWYLKGYVENNGLTSDVELFKGDGYTFITFRNNIFFSGDSAVLRSEGKEVLDVLGKAFKPITKQIKAIRFEGHTAREGTAAQPNHSVFDWELSGNRAKNVLLYMFQKNVVDAGKMTYTGNGDYHPVVPHDGTEKTRIKNRRVEIYIAKNGGKDLSLNQIYDEINSSRNPKK